MVMNIIRVKQCSIRKSPTFWRRAKKSPTFWDADLDRKSRAFGCEREVIWSKHSRLRKSPTFWKA